MNRSIFIEIRIFRPVSNSKIDFNYPDRETGNLGRETVFLVRFLVFLDKIQFLRETKFIT
jgi:hypothetical protein